MISLDLAGAKECPNPLLQELKNPQDQLGACLLFALCYQGISAALLIPWINSLVREHSLSLWEAPVPRHQFLSGCIPPEMQHWKLAPSFPGRVWSIGKWIRKHAATGNWDLQDQSSRIQILQDEIFGISPKSPGQNRLRWVEYLLNLPKPAGLDQGAPILLADGLIPWAEQQKELDRELRKKLGQSFEKDLLALEQMKRFRMRLQHFYTAEEITWIPYTFLLQTLKTPKNSGNSSFLT